MTLSYLHHVPTFQILGVIFGVSKLATNPPPSHPGRRAGGVGMYGYLWTLAVDYLFDIVENIMNLNPQKKPDYRRGLRAMSQLEIL